MTGPICIIGNSHVGSLRQALRDQPERYAHADITMLGAPGKALDALRLTDGVLHLVDDRSRSLVEAISGFGQLPVGRFERFVLVGLGFRVRPAVELFMEVRPWRADQAQGDVPLVSRAVFTATLAARLQRNLAFTLAETILRGTGKPVTIVPQPGPLETMLAAKEDMPDIGAWRAAVARGDEMRELFEAAAMRAAGQRGLALVTQPEATLRHGVMTAAEFGARPATADTPQTDFAHMNAVFGALMLDRILASLSAT